MQVRFRIWLTAIALVCLAQPSFAVRPTPEEMGTAKRWTEANLSISATELPFSFNYDDKSLSDLVKTWKVKQSSRKLDKFRTERTITYLDPATGLSVRLVAVLYSDFPTVEWTLYFKNTGHVDTPILSNILPLDTRFERSGGDFVLHHNIGTPCTPKDYQPLAATLGPGAEKRFSAEYGRPTSSDLPYYNLEFSGGGVICVISWCGQWAAEFKRDAGDGLSIRAGQELTHFKLYPGEEVRSPLIVLQFYKGDWMRAQNVWRRWMIAHNIPRPGGKLPPPMISGCSSHYYAEMTKATEENQKLFIDRYVEAGLNIDFWHMDAGWYPNNGGWGGQTGTWIPDPKRFPHGLRAVTDHAHSKGIKSIVWFQPEIAAPGTWLFLRHPEWLIKADEGQRLLNLGDPEARKWITDHVDRLIVEQGIDLYRQDFNDGPLRFWQAKDTEDRQGITEIRYVEGFFAYWDELRRRHPNMLIDGCSSGGRRNDLESLRRALPLARTDFMFQPVPNQCHTYGIAFWIPYYGTGTGLTNYGGAGAPNVYRGPLNSYVCLSDMCPYNTACWDVRDKSLDYDLLRRFIAERKLVAPNYYGDYYPLTPYSLDENAWMAWQFDRPEIGEGVVQAFRRGECVEESAVYKLKELQASFNYELTDLDSGKKRVMTGRELMEQGLPITIKERPGAAAILYKRRV